MEILRAMAQKVQRDGARWYGMLTRKGEGGSVKNADPTPRREPDTTGEGGPEGRCDNLGFGIWELSMMMEMNDWSDRKGLGEWSMATRS